MVERRLKNIFKKGGSLKVNLVLGAKFEALENGEVVTENTFFNTKNEIILLSKDTNAWFNDVIEEILIKVEDFQQNKSNGSLKKIINLVVNINRYAPLQVGFCTFITMPKYIQSKKAVVNICIFFIFIGYGVCVF